MIFLVWFLDDSVCHIRPLHAINLEVSDEGVFKLHRSATFWLLRYHSTPTLTEATLSAKSSPDLRGRAARCDHDAYSCTGYGCRMSAASIIL